MTLLQRSIFLLGVGALAAGSASATTYELKGGISGNQIDWGGSYDLFFDTTGLPITNSPDLTVQVSNVHGTADVQRYDTDEALHFSGEGGAGQFGQDFDSTYPPDAYTEFDFYAGPLSGYLFFPISFNGTGSVFDNDGDIASGFRIADASAGGTYYVNGSSAPVVTPEPGSISLMLVGLSTTGCAWVGRGRRRLSGR